MGNITLAGQKLRDTTLGARMAFTSKVVPKQRDLVVAETGRLGHAACSWKGKGTFDSCVYTIFAHTIFDSLCIYNVCHFIRTPSSSWQNENIVLAAAGAEVHIDRVQVMHALDT